MPGHSPLQGDAPFLPTPPESPQPRSEGGGSRTGAKPVAGQGMKAVVGRGPRRISVVSIKDAERAARVVASSATSAGGELHHHGPANEFSRVSLLNWLRAKHTQANTGPKGVGDGSAPNVHDLTKENSGNSEFSEENTRLLPIGPSQGVTGAGANLSDAELNRRFDLLLRSLTPAATADVARHLFQIVVSSLPQATSTNNMGMQNASDQDPQFAPALMAPTPLAIQEPASLVSMYEIPTPTNSLGGGHGPLPIRGATPVGMAQSVRSLTSMDSIASFGDLRQFKTVAGKAIADSDGEIKSICEFEVVAELGRGSYGAVSLVVDLTDGKSYAIKTMKRKFARKVLGSVAESKTVRVDERSPKIAPAANPGSGTNTNSTLSSTESPRAEAVSPNANLDHTQGPDTRRLSVDSGPLGGEGSASMDWIEKDIFGNGPKGKAAKELTASPVAVAAAPGFIAPPAARGKPQIVSSPAMGTGTVDLESHSHSHGTAGSSSGAGVSVVDREIAVMKRLNHKNIVQLYSVIEDREANETHLVMQYIENGSPTKLKGNGTCKAIPHPLALYYMVQVSLGLDYLHRHGILHRDVKPENILIGKEHAAYVADFGVSAIVGEDCKATGKGQLTGTMSFFSPEAIKGDPQLVYGVETDVWAFGVSLYCMVYGRLPFVGFSGPALFKAVLENDVPFPQVLLPNESMGKPLKSPSHKVTNTNKPTKGTKDSGKENTTTLGDHPGKLAVPADGISFDQLAADVPAEVRAILQLLLSKDPTKRMSLREFRHHPFVVSTVSQYLTSLGKSVTRKQPSETRLGTHSSHAIREPIRSMPLPPVSLADAQSGESEGPIPILSSPGKRHVAGIPTVTAKDSHSGSTTPNSVASHHPDQELTPLSLGLVADGDQGGAFVLEESFSPLGSGQFLRDALTLEDIQCAVLQQPVSFIHRRPVVSGSAFGVVRNYASRLRDTVRRRSVSDLGYQYSVAQDPLAQQLVPPSPPARVVDQTTSRPRVKEFAPLPSLDDSNPIVLGSPKTTSGSAPKKEKRREKGTTKDEEDVTQVRSARGTGSTRRGEPSDVARSGDSSPKRIAPPNQPPLPTTNGAVTSRANRRESNTAASPPKPPEVHLPPVHRPGRKL